MMATPSYDSFERYKQKGLDARRAGQWDSARIYLLEASRAMLELSKTAQGDELREARRETASKLLDLAKDCDKAKNENRAARAESRAANRSAPASQSESEGAGDGAEWIVREKPTIKFENVAGLEKVKEDIRLKMLYPFEHRELAEKFGINAGGGVLMYGPPGTGKTMLAKATAGEINATFFLIQPGAILSKWVFESEQNIKRLFDAVAKEDRSILFFDEIEAMIPDRSEGKAGSEGQMARVISQLLQSMEGFTKQAGKPVLFMGATNVPWKLDPAVLRPGRFDEKVYIPLPDLPARRRMLELYFAHRPLSADVDLDAIAARLDGYSGADIKYITDQSAVIPFLQSVKSGEEGDINHEVIERVCADVKPSVNAQMLERFEKWANP